MITTARQLKDLIRNLSKKKLLISLFHVGRTTKFFPQIDKTTYL